MPSSKDRRRVEIPTHVFDRLAEIAETEDRTMANVLVEMIWDGLGQYQPTFVPSKHLGRFNERACHALDLAKEEARDFGHNYIGTEHLLLGVLREGESLAADVLVSLGLNLDAAQTWVESRIGRGDAGRSMAIDFTPRARKALSLAMDETEKLGGGYVRTEHILLGVIRDSGGMGVEMLDHFAMLATVRGQVFSRLGRQDPAPVLNG
jgi:ATP-dependent Clp protease ATP-binding subunit ClpC